MDKIPYEVYAIFLNRLSDIVHNNSRHGHYVFWTLLFTYQYIFEKSVSLCI